MLEQPSASKEKSTEPSEPEFMSAVLEASFRLHRIAEPRPVGDSIKAAINRAALRVSKFLDQPMSAGRAEDIWRKEARLIKAEEMDAIRKADAARDKQLVEEARNVLAEYDTRISRLEALLIQDEDFHRDQVATHIKAISGPDRSVDRG